jgi:hypothetical protein
MVTTFADGNVKSLLKSSGDDASSTTGSLGVKLEWRDWALAGRINVVSSLDTLTGEFGGIVLVPGTGSALPSGVVDLTGRIGGDGSNAFERFLNLVGPYAHLYASLSNSIWSDGQQSEVVNISGLGLLLGRYFGGTRVDSGGANGEQRLNSVSIRFELGVAFRGIAGDISAEPEFRERLLQTTQKNFFGLEGGFNLQINKVIAGVQLYYLFPSDGHVRRLTKFQTVFGLGLQADLFTLPFKEFQ